MIGLRFLFLSNSFLLLAERCKDMVIFTSGDSYEAQGGNRFSECFCSSCKQSVGLLGIDEITWHTVNGNEMHCFDCDMVRNDEIPPQLLPGKDEVIIIKDKWGLEQQVICWLNGVALVIARAEMETIPLSTSLTNLHAARGADPEKAGE
jgi:hypothetical protein